MSVVSLPTPVKAPRLHDVPEQLDGATRWTDEPGAYDLDAVLRVADSIPDVRAVLDSYGERESSSGPKRMAGNWARAYIGFTMSGHACFQPWWSRHEHDLPYWRRFGFTRVPAFQTVYQRLTELEDDPSAFLAAARHIVRRLQRRDPRIGAWVHVDATETQTHAQLQHVCTVAACPSKGRARIGSLDNATATEMREASAALLAEDEAKHISVGHLTELEVETASSIPPSVDASKLGLHGRLLKLGGHWWYSRDPNAGTRAYGSGRALKAWHGFLTQLAVDHFTALPVGGRIFAADEQEYNHYKPLMTQVVRTTGATPKIVAGDRGYSITKLYEFNTKHGIASVFPWRRRKNEPAKTQPAPGFDIHGVPTCAACGGPTDSARFRVDKRGGHTIARIVFTCAVPITQDCLKEQSMSCARDWRRVLPLWRTHRAYHAMRQQHQVYEFKHDAMRINYRVAGKTAKERPHRVSLDGLTLRFNCAVLIEWMRFLLRRPAVAAPRKSEGHKVSRGVAYRRLKYGLAGGGIVLLPSSRAGPT